MVRKKMYHKLTFDIGNRRELTTEEVLGTIDDLMIHTKELTIENMHDEINRAVPMETGRLRNSIHSQLDTSFYQARRVNIILSPPVYYGKYVNNFKTSQVRHPIDPEAVGQYTKHLVIECKSRLSLNWELSKLTIGAR